MGEGASLLRWPCTHDGQVSLLHLFVGGEHLVEPGKRLARLGKQHHAAHGTVQAVHHTQIDVAWLGVLLLQIALYGFRQRLVACLVTLHYLSWALAHHDDVIVFVKNFHLYPYIKKNARHTGQCVPGECL